MTAGIGRAPDLDGCDKVRKVLNRVGDRWSMLAVVLLSEGPLRFNEMRRRMGGVSQRMLTLTLRNLERDGLVERAVIPSAPPGVSYELTRLGRSLRPAVEALADWAQANHADIEAANHSFDRRAE